MRSFKVGRKGRNARILFNCPSYRGNTSTFLPVQMTLLMPQLHFLFTVIITLVMPSDVSRERPGPEPIRLRATTGHKTAKRFNPPQLFLWSLLLFLQETKTLCKQRDQNPKHFLQSSGELLQLPANELVALFFMCKNYRSTT